MPNMAFVNGRIMPLSQAYVSVEDRGFQFGDAVYEVVRSYDRKLFEPELHLARLDSSAKAISLDLVYSATRWHVILNKINETCRYRNAKIYIQITRGAAPRNHSFPARSKPTVVINARMMIPLPERLYQKGASVITVPDIRWGRCDIKTTNLLPNVIARQESKKQGFHEALFVRDGIVTEGTSSNVFALIDGRLRTPGVGSSILSGITRSCVLMLAKESGIPADEEDLPLERLLLAKEVFLTGTTVEILPVVRIDGEPVRDGKPGLLTRSLLKQFQELRSGKQPLRFLGDYVIRKH